MPPIGIDVLVIDWPARDVPLWTALKSRDAVHPLHLVRLPRPVAFPILSTFLPSRM
jgi:hypothetical protein